MDERQIVRRAQRGDRAAFLKLVQPYYERVYATADRLLGNRDDAAEIAQEAILRTFWKIRAFHGRAHFYTWLYRTALNLCYRRLSDTHAQFARRAVPLSESDDEEEGRPSEPPLRDDRPTPRDAAEQAEEVRLVRQALGSLHRRDFQILVLREFEDLPYQAIARRLKLAQGTVMSRLHRARSALAERLRALGVE